MKRTYNEHKQFINNNDNRRKKVTRAKPRTQFIKHFIENIGTNSCKDRKVTVINCLTDLRIIKNTSTKTNCWNLGFCVDGNRCKILIVKLLVIRHVLYIYMRY